MAVASLELRKNGAIVSKQSQVLMQPNLIAADTYRDGGDEWQVYAVLTDVPINRFGEALSTLEGFTTSELLDEVKRRVEAEATDVDYDDWADEG